ncbi:MAG: hypothetical protein GY906_08130 [bacterium]|nr:hypothetical protein [bacterium]
METHTNQHEAEHEYRYVLELYREDGEQIGQAIIDADWEPAIEWTRFERLRHHDPQTNGAHPGAVIRPVWHTDVGEPYLHGFSVTLPETGQTGTTAQFPIHYFARAAQFASSKLVEMGKLADGELFRYLAMAFRCQNANETSKNRFAAEDRSAATAVLTTQAHIDELRQASDHRGSPHSGDMPVLVPQSILDEVSTLTNETSDREVGGILIGHLCRNTEESQLFAVVTELIQARHTVSESTRLTFTSDTWTDVRAAVDLRKRNELILGWYHSHPIAQWRQSTESDEGEQHKTLDFFSEYDRALHRTVFAPAYCIALVASHLGENKLSHALYGWRHGLIQARGYHVPPEDLDTQWIEDVPHEGG